MINVSDFPTIERVIGFFEEITKIPRGSGNTKMIADYLSSFARERGLKYVYDEYDNVIIYKNATKGFEEKPTVVLQGHTDIVCEKEPWCEIDMEKEGVRIFRDGDFIKADGTTLGADDGIAIAYALALLDSKDIPHPSIEAVFTSDEETGLTGAMNIDGERINGRIMLNLDSGDEGVFTVGCAGGVRADISLPIEREKSSARAYKISVEELLGGHSGVEIDKGRKNAIKLLSELLSTIPSVKLSDLFGGNADNAIPREAYAVILAEEEPDKEALSKMATKLAQKEPIRFKIEVCEIPESVMNESTTRNILSLIQKLPTGVYKMSEDIEGLVETSSNVGVAHTGDDTFELTISVRSSKAVEKKELLEKIVAIAKEHGAGIDTRGDYPGWEYKKDSHLREVMRKSWKKLYKEEPKIIMIHAGLECGIFSDKLEGLDCVSTGPDHFDIHTPKERLSLSSTEKVWSFILDVLKNI